MEETEEVIYENGDERGSSEDVSGPQPLMGDNNAAGGHTRGQSSKIVKGTLPCVAVCLGMLCLMVLAVIIRLQAVHYNSVINNVTLERNQLQSKVHQLKREKAVKSCSRGWRKFECSCYYKSTIRKTWDESREECLKTGADLVVINNKEEQEFIKGLLKEGRWSPWIGLNRTGVDWTWVDGTPLTTQYWETGSGCPADTEDWNCAYYRNGTWYNRDCSAAKRGWICEM